MTKREKIGLGAALALALLVRVLCALSLEGAPFYDQPIVDSEAYDDWAQRIAGGQIVGDRVFYQDPLYPYGLGIFYAVFGHTLLGARLAQCVLGTLGLWLLFEAVRRFLGYRTAIVALLLGALYKTLVFYDATLLKDFLAVIAVEAALLFWSLDTKWKWAAFGAALGLGTLARGNMLLLALVAAGFLAVRREWKPAGLVVAGTLAAIAPVTIRNLAVSGDFVLTTAQLGPNLYTGNNPENTTGRYRPPSFLEAGTTEAEEKGFRAEAERRLRRPLKSSEIDAYWRGQAIDYIAANPGTFIAVTGKRLLMLLNGFEIPDDYNPYFLARFSRVLRLPLFTFGLFLAPLAAAGIYLAWIERKRFAIPYLLLGAYAASILLFFVFARYRLPVVPFLLVFAAHAVSKFIDLKGHGFRQVPKTAAIVFLATAVLVNLPLPASIGGHRDFRAAHYNLGIYYATHDQPAAATLEFESAARLNPEYLKFLPFVQATAEAYERSGRDEKALEHYTRVLVLSPKRPDILARMGGIYLRAGALDRAAQRLTEALTLDPALVDAYVPLAEAHLRRKAPHVALGYLDGGIRIAPKEWTLRLKRAEIHRDLGMWKEALADADAVLSLHADERAARIRAEARAKLGLK